MDSLICKNIYSENISVNDLGIYLRVNEDLDLIENFSPEEIIESTDLEEIYNLGQIAFFLNSNSITYQELIDYFTPLSKFDKIDYSYISEKDDNTDITGIELEQLSSGGDATNLHNHNSIYYTKTELQTPGSAQIDWNNLINVPSLGSLSWKEPVDRTDLSYGSGTTLPITNNNINDARVVKDDGDGKGAIYVCIATSGSWDTQWIKMADVDWGKANSIGFTPTSTIISTNVQSAIEEVDTKINNLTLDNAYNNGNLIDIDYNNLVFKLNDFDFNINDKNNNILINISESGIYIDNVETSINSINLFFKDQYLNNSISLSELNNNQLNNFTANSIIGALNELKEFDVNITLDVAYNGYFGNGSGKIINVNSGAVNFISSNYAPIQLTNLTSPPNQDLQEGQIALINNELYYYDNIRGKWLSKNTYKYIYSENFADGKIMSIGYAKGNKVGYILKDLMTLIKIVVYIGNGNLNKRFKIFKNLNTVSLKTFKAVNGSYISTNDNIDFDINDIVQVYAVSAGLAAKDVVVELYFKKRGE